MRPMKKASGQSDVTNELSVLRVCAAIDPVLSNNMVKFHFPIGYAPLYRRYWLVFVFTIDN